MTTVMLTMPTIRRTTRPPRDRRAAAPPAPPRPPRSVDGPGDDDLNNLADALIALAIMLRSHPAGVVEPDAGAVRLARWCVLVADDCLTVAGGLMLDPGPFNVAQEVVGALPGGADQPIIEGDIAGGRAW